MKCMNCGYDNDENAHFCIYCGSALPYNQNPLKGIMPPLLGDGLFLAICILYSASAALLLIGRDIPIIKILMAIFLWLLFAQREKGMVDSKYVRYISGTIFAHYIVRWIVGCMLVLCGIFLMVVSVLMEESSWWEMIYFAVRPYIARYIRIGGEFAGVYLVMFSFALVIGAIIGLITNVAGVRSIHRFVQSLYRSLEDGKTNITGRETAQIWLKIYGIFGVFFSSGSGGFFSHLGGICQAVALILFSILIKKYFDKYK